MTRTLILGLSACALVLGAHAKSLRDYVAAFNAADEELYTNAVPNAAAADFLERNVPAFECPDPDVERTYAFRWWTYRKHLKKTADGWVVTEFLPDVSWAGKHNTISCPLGHHLREGRWLRDAAFLDDYIHFMVTQGSVNGPRAYACWPAWAARERAKVTGDAAYAKRHLPEFVRNWEAWAAGWKLRNGTQAGLRADRGLFDFIGDREGTEYALSKDGARPMVNSAMWAEAWAIARIAHDAGDKDLAARFDRRADALREAIQARLWNPSVSFFTTLGFDGTLDGVRELHGYAPFYFRMPQPAGRLAAWDGLMDEKGFFAPVGLVFPRRDTPGFDVEIDYGKHECLWNGPTWPYATSVALTALYETLQAGQRPEKATAADFAKLVAQYARQHVRVREDGKTVPWIDENQHPFSGLWISRDVLIEQARRRGQAPKYRERGKDYNHSTFCDLVIAGLCGLVPHQDGSLDVRPLAPADWDWWRLSNVRYHGHDLTVTWDRTGAKYGAKGLTVVRDGEVVVRGASAPLKVAPNAPYRAFAAADRATRRALMTNDVFRAEAAKGGTPPAGAGLFLPRWESAVRNLRDLGGWRAAGGRRIRFGRLYRSAVHLRKGQDPRAGFKSLGVRTELDLRDPAKDAKPFDADLRYVTLGKSAPAYEGVFSEKARPLVRKMFDVLLDETNYPVVFHCSQGADRTGTLAALVELLLGVAEDDVSRDWQLTIFHNPNPKFRDAERYDRFLARLSEFPGADLQEKTAAFLRTCGLSDADFAKLRDLLLEAPLFTFGFVSDTHVTGDLSRGRGKGRVNDGFPKALAWFRGAGVDAVVNAGDLTEGGNLEEVGLYCDMFRSAFPSNAPAHFSVWGNHDVLDASYMRRMDLSAECMRSIPTNHADVCRRVDGFVHERGSAWSRQLRGVWFVGVDWKAEAAALPVLEEVAGKAAGRPFFFVQHSPAALPALAAFLAKHPNCIRLTGHSHVRLDEPRAAVLRARGRAELAGGSTDAHASVVRVWPDCVTVERRDLRSGRDLPDLAVLPR